MALLRVKSTPLPSIRPQLPSLHRVPEDLYARAHYFFAHGYRQAAVFELCTAQQTRITPRGLHDLGAILDASIVMQVCGFVILNGVFGQQDVSQWRNSNHNDFWEFYNSTVVPHPDLLHADSYETEVFAIRSAGRYEYKLPLKLPYTSDELVANLVVHLVMLASMRAHKIRLDTFSCVVSLPLSPVQHW